MGLLKKKTEYIIKEHQVMPMEGFKKQKLLQTMSFQQGKTYRGHKRITVSSQNDIKAVENINHIKILNPDYELDPESTKVPDGYSISEREIDKYSFDLSEKPIELKSYLRDGAPEIDIYISGYYIGKIAIGNDEKRTTLYESIVNKNILSIYIKIVPMIHNKVVSDTKRKRIIESEERFKVYLYYKA